MYIRPYSSFSPNQLPTRHGVQVASPQSARNQTSQENSSFSNGPGPLFSLYVKMAEEEDTKMADRWQKDADGILIFVSFHISFHTTSQDPT
jgi:hypothetical protein